MQAESGRSIVIVAYKPKPGKDADLLQLTREHIALLRAEGLATDHPVTTCQTKDGTVVEVFEWAAGGPEGAHTNPAVLKLWEALRRRLRLRATSLAGRILRPVRIVHSPQILGKQLLLCCSAAHTPRRSPASILIPRQQGIARTLPQTVPAARSIDHLCQPFAIFFSGEVSGGKTFRIIRLQRGKVLTNKA